MLHPRVGPNPGMGVIGPRDQSVLGLREGVEMLHPATSVQLNDFEQLAEGNS